MANRPIGALWQKKSQTGTAYLSGVINNGVFGECAIVIFKAMEKRSDASPDFIVYASTPQRQNGTGATAPAEPGAEADDDIPF
jgi:hypothetical protein